MNKNCSIFCGIDISKEWMDISIASTVTRVNQNKKEINTFIKKALSQPADTLIVLESTGGYERLAVQCFDAAGATIHIVHPNKVRNFAKAKGQLAKTDKIDAMILAEYGRFIEPSCIRPLSSELEQNLHALNSRLAQLKEIHHQEACRLGTAHTAEVKDTHEKMLVFVEKQMVQIEQEIKALIESDPTLQERYIRLQTMKGVGPTLALTLVAVLPELGYANKKEIAALVGVAPITKDSGKQRGRAMTQNGRAGLRRILYMGALTAIRYDKRMGDFYNRLIGSGKAKKVGIVAVMRKMLVVMNTMLATAEDYIPQEEN